MFGVCRNGGPSLVIKLCLVHLFCALLEVSIDSMYIGIRCSMLNGEVSHRKLVYAGSILVFSNSTVDT